MALVHGSHQHLKVGYRLVPDFIAAKLPECPPPYGQSSGLSRESGLQNTEKDGHKPKGVGWAVLTGNFYVLCTFELQVHFRELALLTLFLC